MSKCICISCGAQKRAPYARCRCCGLDPSTDEASLVKSVYLSTGRFVTGSETDEEEERKAQYAAELDDLARALRSGKQVNYDPDELARLSAQYRLMKSVPRRAIWGAVFRTFLPAFALGAVLLLAILFLRIATSCRR
jgi:hypothetical protein